MPRKNRIEITVQREFDGKTRDFGVAVAPRWQWATQDEPHLEEIEWWYDCDFGCTHTLNMSQIRKLGHLTEGEKAKALELAEV